jgi:exoribonuclease R
MLPTILSDCLCSLQENKNRIAFVLDLVIENDTIVSFHFSNCIICVNKNYIYESDTLLKMPDYLSHIWNLAILANKTNQPKIY